MSGLKRAAWAAGVLLVVEVAAASTLDGVDVVERLLAPGGGSGGLAVAAVVFLVVRLVLYFVAPGVVVGALVLEVAERWG